LSGAGFWATTLDGGEESVLGTGFVSISISEESEEGER
jgi:hypothetical protein